MAEQQYEAAAIEAGVQSLSYVQLLTLYHQIQNTDGGDYNAKFGSSSRTARK